MIRKELKCKFPPCPCQKCVVLRSERLAGGLNAKNTTPERSGFDERSPNENKEKHTDEEGCCNTDHNFITFIINVVSFVAFSSVALLVFWLKMFHWAIVLCLKVYNSSRTTQVAVGGAVGLLLLCMTVNYAMRGNKNPTKSKNRTTLCKGLNCGSEARDESARKVYKQSQWYAAPIDMKQPPTFLFYLRKIIFKES